MSSGVCNRRRRTSKSEIPTRKNPKLKSGDEESLDSAKMTLAIATASAYSPNRIAVVAAYRNVRRTITRTFNIWNRTIAYANVSGMKIIGTMP